MHHGQRASFKAIRVRSTGLADLAIQQKRSLRLELEGARVGTDFSFLQFLDVAFLGKIILRVRKKFELVWAIPFIQVLEMLEQGAASQKSLLAFRPKLSIESPKVTFPCPQGLSVESRAQMSDISD